MEKLGIHEKQADDHMNVLYGGEYFENEADYSNLEDLASPDSYHAISLVNQSFKKDICSMATNVGLKIIETQNQPIFDSDKQRCNDSVIPSLCRAICGENVLGDEIIISTGLVRTIGKRDEQEMGTFHQLGIAYIPSEDGDGSFNQIVKAISENEVLNGRGVVLRKANSDQIINALALNDEVGGYNELLKVGYLDTSKYSNIDQQLPKLPIVLINLDKMLMMKKGLKDMRLIRSHAWRNEIQMYDLLKFNRSGQEKYSAARDISYCVKNDTSNEQICEKILGVAGDQSPLIQRIEIINEDSYDNMHPNAIARLGMTEKMKNIVVRITLGHPDCPVTMKDTNVILGKIYPQIHEGLTRGYL